MGKIGYLSLAVALTLLAGIDRLSSGPGPWALDREKGFIGGLHNSLSLLDQAKQQWAADKNKSELDVPTLDDLKPYLGDKRDGIQRFITLGIKFKITSTVETQSDVATLTRDLRFRRGYCLFYPAGTRYCMQTGWVYPPAGATAKSFGILWVENNLDRLCEAALVFLVVGNVLVFLVKKHRKLKHESRH